MESPAIPQTPSRRTSRPSSSFASESQIQQCSTNTMGSPAIPQTPSRRTTRSSSSLASESLIQQSSPNTVESPAIPQTPSRRTTRSSSSLASESQIQQSSPINQTPSLPQTDLLFSGDRIDFQSLISSLPGRELEIREIVNLIGPGNSPMIPVLVYGGASTGKTTVVLQIFRHLYRFFVYTSCRSCHSPRILFESVLNQLLFHRKNQANGYSSAKRCERVSDFVNFLRDALVSAIEVIKKSRKKKGFGDGNGEMIYLVFDNVELIRSWGKNLGVLKLLLRLHDILKIPELGLIYISRAAPEAYHLNFGSTEPVWVFFPDYSEDDLRNIFMKNHANPELYKSFLSAALRTHCGITRRVDELEISFSSLYHKYCIPLRGKNVVPDENTKMMLYGKFKPYIRDSLKEIFEVPSWVNESNKDGCCGVGKASKELGIHMSLSAKYLLISAFLASRNPATLDAAMFDPMGGTTDKKRKRKSSATVTDKKEQAAAEVLIKGPGSFPLERLLAIFQCITSVAEDAPEEEQMGDKTACEDPNSVLMADVLLQISTLCNANFVSKSGSCPLEGSIRYRCMIDEDIAMKVARSIHFPLSNYLYRR